MADIKFSQLPYLTGANVTNDTTFPVVENGFNWQLTAGNLQAFVFNDKSVNVTGNVIYGNSFVYLGNGQPVANYSNANVTAYIPTDPTILSIESNVANNTANITILQGNVVTLTNSTSNNSSNIAILQGNVANLQYATYANSNVSSYLASGTDTANIITLGNVSGSYLLGNGAFITGLPPAYANSNVSAYLSSGAFTSNIYSNVTATPYTLQNYKEGVYTLPYAATLAPAPINGSMQTVTLTGNVTINGLVSGAPAGTNVVLIIKQDAVGGRLLTSSMKFAGGVDQLSLSANSVDTMTIFYDGTTYYAALSLGYV